MTNSDDGHISLVSRAEGRSSFLYRVSGNGGKRVRLSSVAKGIESEPSVSHDGRLVAYSFAEDGDSKSQVWVVGSDGKGAHALVSEDVDALHPKFSPDDTLVYFAVSGRFGHSSPIASSRRHDWDIFSIPVTSIAGANPETGQITHQSFYDLQSLDVAADEISPRGTRILISTTGYPIGPLIEEFILDSGGRNKIFQPHVPGEPSTGAAFGEACFSRDGMEILFLAATDSASGNFDYNVYSMSDITGAEIKKLTKLKGMTTRLRVEPGGRATFLNGGRSYELDLITQAIRAL